MSLVHLQSPIIAAEANWGRWIAQCPVCPSALKLTRGDSSFQCWECGAEAGVLWPDNMSDIERLLMMRPLPQTRNWSPGETLHDLLAENVAHGIGPLEPEQVMEIVGDRIAVDSLPASRARLKIGA